MMKIYKLNYLILSFFFIISCGYQPLYSNKEINFYIYKINSFGDEKINKALINKLELYKDKNSNKKKIPRIPINDWYVLFLITDILSAKIGFIVGIVIKVTHISKKFTIMEVTMISIPKKKSPAKWEPKTPMLDIAPATIKEICGVKFFGWTLEIIDGKIPSSAQANINLDTDNNIAGRSLISAIAAPRTIATPNHDGKT